MAGWLALDLAVLNQCFFAELKMGNFISAFDCNNHSI